MPPSTTSCGAGAPAACGLGLGRLVCNLYFCVHKEKKRESLCIQKLYIYIYILNNKNIILFKKLNFVNN